jgi:hypothetical protein
MRIGQNPAKFIDQVAQPAKITVAIVTYIPFLGGYYAESLDVLKACLSSIWENTDLPYDLMIFDNASCKMVRQFLIEAQHQEHIQYLVLSDKNIGKSGAWNIIFSGAPGEIIAYADSDIYFFPGWLPAHIKVLEQFPNTGMVTGMPLWSPDEFSTSTVEWAQKNPQARLERGQLLTWEDYWRHSRSLGKDEAEARQHYGEHQDICLFYQGQKYYVGAGHFQFAARRKALQDALPIPSERPMGQVRSLDKSLNAKGYLRLSTSEWWIQHIGNTLDGLKGLPGYHQQRLVHKGKTSKANRLFSWGPVRKMLVWMQNKSFEILYRSKTS